MKTKDKNKKILDVGIFIAWLVISVLCLYIFVDRDMVGLSISVFSQFFLVAGLSLIKYSQPGYKADKHIASGGHARRRIKITVELVIGLLISYLSGGVVLFGIIYQIVDKSLRSNVLRMLPAFLCTAFPVFGLGYMAAAIYRLNYRKKYITYSVNATVLKIEHSTGGTGEFSGTGLAPTWGYDYDGIHYETKQDFFSYRCRCKQGNIMEIKINPRIPTEIDGGNETPIMNILFGTTFFVTGAIAVFVMIAAF